MQALTTHDGVPLHLRGWSAAGAARGSVLIVHGLGEHIGRYEHVAAHLNACGWHVDGYDHRGHGSSGGARGFIPDHDSLLLDLSRVIDSLRQARGEPMVLLGHSMGGLVAARFVAEGLASQPAPWWRPVDALALSSPALDAGLNLFQKLLLAVLGPLAPGLALGNGLNPSNISRDADVVQAYRSDPLVHDRITPRLARFIVDAGLLVRERAARWSLPTLLLWAGMDRLVAPAGSAAFAAAANPRVLSAHCYPALYHEIFNAPERAQVLDELSRWLAARASQ